MVTFLADNYAPFHSMPVECTDRDAAFVLDGLLYNESDLEIESFRQSSDGPKIVTECNPPTRMKSRSIQKNAEVV